MYDTLTGATELVGIIARKGDDAPHRTTPTVNNTTTPLDLAAYLRGFDYDERTAMKIQTKELLDLYAAGRAQLIDIRFADEARAWSIGIGQQIPLNELPDRLHELDPAKTIVTMCPHYDRAEIARLYLTMQGFTSRYLTDGMLGLADFLRGDRARDFVARLGTPE